MLSRSKFFKIVGQRDKMGNETIFGGVALTSNNTEKSYSENLLFPWTVPLWHCQTSFRVQLGKYADLRSRRHTIFNEEIGEAATVFQKAPWKVKI